MTDHSAPFFSTPRLVAGLIVSTLVFAGCHRQPSESAPTPPTSPAPAPQTRSAPATANITSGRALLQAMHERYAAGWYRTLTFTQKTTVALSSGGEVVQTWYEAGEVPGRLRIDTDRASKGGVIYARDSIFSFTNGKLARADTGMNDLLVLGFDVYVQPVATSEAVLRRLGFDLTHIHEARWQGKPVYVVGAVPGDTTSKQFWIERDRLLFVRLIEHTRQGRADIRFNEYVKYGGGWLAVEVDQLVNGKRRTLEQYSDVKTNVLLSEALFDPKQWATAPHWAPQRRD
ncbi:MAG: hypothetical protein ABJF01_14945 [bacterium]